MKLSVNFISILGLSLLLAVNCASAQSPVQHITVGRLIVKPKMSMDAASLMLSIRKALPQEQRIQLFRAMSGDAYVLNVISPATGKDVPEIISLLNETKLFEYVELDAMMNIRKQR